MKTRREAEAEAMNEALKDRRGKRGRGEIVGGEKTASHEPIPA